MCVWGGGDTCVCPLFLFLISLVFSINDTARVLDLFLPSFARADVREHEVFPCYFCAARGGVRALISAGCARSPQIEHFGMHFSVGGRALRRVCAWAECARGPQTGRSCTG